ncbi:MAG: hypothetical protein V8T87_00630 [Victivallales bacterium]
MKTLVFPLEVRTEEQGTWKEEVGKTFEQFNIGTIQQSKEKRRSRIRGLAMFRPALLPE